VARDEKRNASLGLVEKPGGKRQLARPRGIWTLQMDFETKQKT
jgi:hypothetical protein